MSATQLQMNLDNIKNQNETLTGIYTKSPLITPILVGIANAAQPKMWINRISYTSTFPTKKKGEGSLEITGAIASGKESGEDIAIGGAFKDALMQQPELRQLCRNAAIRYGSISAAGTGRTRKRGGSTTATSTSAETQFTATCSVASAKKSAGKRLGGGGVRSAI